MNNELRNMSLEDLQVRGKALHKEITACLESEEGVSDHVRSLKKECDAIHGEWEYRHYRASNWTIYCDEGNMNDCINGLETEWNAIKEEFPEFNAENVNPILDRIYATASPFGFADSEVRQALFHRMVDFYNVDYDVIYESWLGHFSEADVLLQEVSEPKEYAYAGQPLTVEITKELIVLLFEGKIAHQDEIWEKVVSFHLEGGGLPPETEDDIPGLDELLQDISDLIDTE